ncbi:MAG: helix-turn-helix domain-containing protein [Clostridia bacterium]|nr:helix-turn-helix domain-containing protein [Clostridia bacterium]
MKEKNLNNKTLAQATKIHATDISNYLHNVRTPSFEHFIKLLYYFECSADYLLGLTEIPTEEPLHEVLPFHTRLRSLLKERDISQERLKRELPVSGSVVYKWVSGKSQPCMYTLIKLAKYLDCSVDYLIGRVR